MQGAQQFGYIFDVRTPRTVEVETLFGREKYEILNVLDFTSARKRMSVIVKSPNLKIILFCKVGIIKLKIFKIVFIQMHYIYVYINFASGC